MDLTDLRFGSFVREQRIASQMTQAQLADRASACLREMNLASTISQNAIAQYERDKIYPTLAKMVALARVLQFDYFELIVRVAYSQFKQSAYEVERLAPEIEAALQEQRLRLLLAALKRFPNVGEVPSQKLELLQLQTKALIVSHAEVLGLEGVAEWQSNYPELEEFWICNLYWMDARKPILKEITVQHLRNRCRYVYFVPPEDLKPKGKFSLFISDLTSILGFDPSPQITAVPVTRGDIPKVRLDFVVANPHKIDRAVAFSNLRYGGASKAYSKDSKNVSAVQYSFRMDQEVLVRDVTSLQEFAKTKNLLIGGLRSSG